MKAARPCYVLTLRAEPNIDAIRMLRLALKVLLRRFGLKAITLHEQSDEAPAHQQTK
jgi:hypothetical protein